MITYLIILLQFLGGLFASGEREREQRIARAMLEMARIQRQSPLTEIHLTNRSGRPIDTCVLVFFSDPKNNRHSFHCHSRRAGPFGEESTALERHRWPEPFVLGSVSLLRAGQEERHELNFVCKPGDKLLVVIGAKGEVSVKKDE